MEDRNFTGFPVLKTGRLILRQLIPEDEQEIFALRSSESVNRYLDRKPARTIADAANFIRVIHENVQKKESLYWAITKQDSDKLIGIICLFQFSDNNTRAEIGYELLPGFQGKGMMQEAAAAVIDFGCQQMGLHCMEANTHPDNSRSIRLLEKLGFVKQEPGEGGVLVFRRTNPGRGESTSGNRHTGNDTV